MREHRDVHYADEHSKVDELSAFARKYSVLFGNKSLVENRIATSLGFLTIVLGDNLLALLIFTKYLTVTDWQEASTTLPSFHCLSSLL